MLVRHHLYTFLPEKEGRRGGAQTVFLSPALSAEDRARLERHCLYERPNWLGPDEDLGRYPVAHGYFLLDGARGVLSRVVYRGRHGIRAGNFLAHHLVFPLAAWEAQDPLAYLAEDSLFLRDFQEGVSLPDATLPAPRPLSPAPLKILAESLGSFGQYLLAAALASLEGGGQGRRVVAALPPEFFAPRGPLLLFAIALSRLLPPTMRPAFTLRTYQPDPTEIRLRFVFTPTSSPHIKTIKNDPAFLLADPQAAHPSPVPENAAEYAQVVWGLATRGEEARLALVQAFSGALALRANLLGKLRLPLREILSLALLTAEAKSEDEASRMLDAIEAGEDAISELLGARLLERLGGPYFQALSQKKGSRLGLRLLALAAKEPLSPEAKSALRGAFALVAEAPDQAPWKEVIRLLGSLDEAARKEALSLLAPRVTEIAAALDEEQLLSLALLPEAPEALLQAGTKELVARGRLKDLWSRWEPLARKAFLPQEAPLLFALLRRADLHPAAGEVFLRHLSLSSALPSLLALLPDAVDTLTRARYQDDQIGQELLTRAPHEALPELIAFAVRAGLMGAWRHALAGVAPEVFSQAADILQSTGEEERLLEELARVGLSRQAARLRADRAAAEKRDLFASLIAPAFASPRGPEELGVLLDTVLEKPEGANLAGRILEWLAERGQQARWAPHVLALAARVYAKVPASREKAILPATLLDRRATRSLAARLVREELDLLPTERRRPYLRNLVRRLSLLAIEEHEIAEALFRALAGAPDDRLRWLSQEAEESGLSGIARFVRVKERHPGEGKER